MPIKRHLRTDHQTTEPRSQNVILNGCQVETVVGLPWAADSCPWVEKLRTVLPLSDVIRDSAPQLVLTHQRGAYLAEELLEHLQHAAVALLAQLVARVGRRDHLDDPALVARGDDAVREDVQLQVRR